MEPNLENVSNEIVGASSSVTPSVDKTPKTSKGLLVATIIFAVIAIAGIAAAIYFFIDANNKATANADLRAKLDLVKMETGAELVEKEENGTTVTVVEVTSTRAEEVKKIVTQVYDSLTKNISGGTFYTVFGNGSLIKIPDSNIYTFSNESYGVTSASYYYDSAIGNTIMQSADSFASAVLTNNGFIEDKETMSGKLFYNSNTDIYCITSGQSLPYSLTCSKATWILAEDRDLSLTLAKVADVDFISASQSAIQDSSVSPYQKLMARGENYAALFYRVSPDSEWQFFTGTQGVLPCSEYTGDIAKAFAGDTCYDEATGQNSIVQP